jgi:hypothetical protein
MIDPDSGFCTTEATNGGNGGGASGGGVYKLGTGTISGLGLIVGNTATGGLGGIGGATTAPCIETTTNGSNGTVGGNDIAP